ncbi:MAG: hypothetical protein HY332_10900 [Chloroflexi bacterium]|nr:hypothetical protein [Chloroflexota bacterium]
MMPAPGGGRRPPGRADLFSTQHVPDEPFLHLAVKCAGVIALDDDAGARARSAKLTFELYPAAYDAYFAVVRIVDEIAALLPLVDILLDKANLMAARVQRPAHAAVVGSGAVPVRGCGAIGARNLCLRVSTEDVRYGAATT